VGTMVAGTEVADTGLTSTHPRASLSRSPAFGSVFRRCISPRRKGSRDVVGTSNSRRSDLLEKPTDRNPWDQGNTGSDVMLDDVAGDGWHASIQGVVLVMSRRAARKAKSGVSELAPTLQAILKSSA
jgi:hypothetical protein